MRMRILAAALLIVAGCQSSPPAPAVSSAPEPTPKPGDTKFSMTWNGKERTYHVHAPANYDGSKSLPVVVVMHFYPGTGPEVAVTSAMSAKADKENFLVVYPDGFAAGMNALVCCGSEDDVGFIKSIVGKMVKDWKADPKKVYATGISNGADMSYRLAVETDLFAAIAPVSGAYSGQLTTDAAYMPKRPVSVIQFAGGLDRFYARINAGLETWQTRLKCMPAGQTTITGDVTRTVHKCGDGSEVVVYRVPKMGHSWPGAKSGGLSDPNAGIDATDLMWEFFKAH